MRMPKQSKPLIRMTAPVDEEIGLGDVVSKITGKIGFKACDGCNKRAAMLNNWVSFSPNQGPK